MSARGGSRTSMFSVRLPLSGTKKLLFDAHPHKFGSSSVLQNNSKIFPSFTRHLDPILLKDRFGKQFSTSRTVVISKKLFAWNTGVSPSITRFNVNSTILILGRNFCNHRYDWNPNLYDPRNWREKKAYREGMHDERMYWKKLVNDHGGKDTFNEWEHWQSQRDPWAQRNAINSQAHFSLGLIMLLAVVVIALPLWENATSFAYPLWQHTSLAGLVEMLEGTMPKRIDDPYTEYLFEQMDDGGGDFFGTEEEFWEPDDEEGDDEEDTELMLKNNVDIIEDEEPSEFSEEFHISNWVGDLYTEMAFGACVKNPRVLATLGSPIIRFQPNEIDWQEGTAYTYQFYLFGTQRQAIVNVSFTHTSNAVFYLIGIEVDFLDGTAMEIPVPHAQRFLDLKLVEQQLWKRELDYEDNPDSHKRVKQHQHFPWTRKQLLEQDVAMDDFWRDNGFPDMDHYTPFGTMNLPPQLLLQDYVEQNETMKYMYNLPQDYLDLHEAEIHSPESFRSEWDQKKQKFSWVEEDADGNPVPPEVIARRESLKDYQTKYTDDQLGGLFTKIQNHQRNKDKQGRLPTINDEVMRRYGQPQRRQQPRE